MCSAHFRCWRSSPIGIEGGRFAGPRRWIAYGMVINRMFADTATLMGPGFDAPEREIVGVGGRPAFRLLRLDHLIGNALTLAIGYRLFLAVETKGDLLLH